MASSVCAMSAPASPESKKSTLSKQASTSIKSKDREREHIVVYLPANFPSCPPGLEKLIQADHLFVRQGIRLQEPPFTLICKHRFEVLNGVGERLFTAREATDNILKLCCRGGCGQPFEMSIKDKTSGYEILAISGHPDCYGALTASVSQNGMTLGFLNEELRCCSSNYSLIDAQGNEIFRIYDVSSFRSKWNPNSSTKKINSANSSSPIDTGMTDPSSPTIRNGTNDPATTDPNRIRTTTTTTANRSYTSPDRNLTPNNDNNRKNPEPPHNHNHQGDRNGSFGDSSSSSFATTFDDIVSQPITSEITASPKQTTTITTNRPTSYNASESSTSIATTVVPMNKPKTVTYSPDIPNDVDQPNSSKFFNSPTNSSNAPITFEPRARSPRSKTCCNLGIGHCLDSCVSLISGGVEFDLYSCEMGAVVGQMGKQWGDLYDQYFNLVDCFGVNFPRDLSVRHKVLILGALFLLDFNHFQI